MHLCTICETIFLVGGPWKSNGTLEKSLKNPWKKVAIFCINPGLVYSVVAYPYKSLLDKHSIFNSLDAMSFQGLK